MIKFALIMVFLAVEISCDVAFKLATMNSVTDFEDLIRCTTFVDKTNFISTYFHNIGPRQFLLITCPRKFGKSTNLKMLKSFVQMSINEKGEKVINASATQAYRLFTDRSLDLNIANTLTTRGSLYERHFKKYAVIHVSFKTYGGSDYEHILKSLSDNIKSCFEAYEWLYKNLSNHLPFADTYSVKRKQVQFIEKVLIGKMDEDDVVRALYELSKLLHDHVSTNVFLLIDDYDAPIINAHEHGQETVPIGKLIERIFAKLMNADHTYVKYALITGTSNVFKSRFGNIKHLNFLENHPFSQYFGFTDNEVVQLFEQHSVNVNETKRIKRNYKGYTVASSLLKIYNPFSIVHCLNNRDFHGGTIKIHGYWIEAGKAPCLLPFLKKFRFCGLIAELVVRKKVKFVLKRSLGTTELDTLTQLSNNQSQEIKQYHVDLLLSYLFETGYLSYTNEMHTYTIPNREVESYYLNYLYTFYSDVGGINLDSIRDTLGSVVSSADTNNLVQFNAEQVLEATFRKKYSSYQFARVSDYHFPSIVYCAAKQYPLENGEVSVVDLDEGRGQGVFMVVEVKNKVVFLLELKYEGSLYTERDEKARVKKVCHKIIEQKVNEEE